ncbi:MAG: C40 family peptidase [Firmicutes bacterium]|nr:C40 family peptidase [Bacillota bacterium]
MDYSRAFKDAVNEITYLKGKYREGQEKGDQGLSDWAAKEAEQHYDIMARESPRHADMLRSIGYEAAQLYNRQIPAKPDAAQTSASAYGRGTFSPEWRDSNPTRAGMGEVKAAERRTPYTLAERRQIDDAVERAARPVAAGPDYGWQRPTWSGDIPRLGMPEEHLPGRGLLERNISFGLQKVLKPAVEMDNLYKGYGNMGSEVLYKTPNAGEEQPPSWLEKVAKFLEPASRAQEETGGGLGLVTPPGSFNIFNQPEPEPPVSFEQLYKDSRPKHGTFSKAWLRDGFTPKNDFPKAKVLTSEDELVYLDWTRRDLVDTAMSLEGLPYFWGGKHPHIGMNPEWMAMRKVTAPDSRTTGHWIANGLDCSGFVDWVYAQALLPLGYKLASDGGTESQFKSMKTISRDELRPGDVAFQVKVTDAGIEVPHVGIYIGKDEAGNNLYIHAYGEELVGDFEGGIIKVSTYPKFTKFKRPNVVFKDDQR